MKKLLYYSVFIPIIGLIIHMFWIVFKYELYSTHEDAPKCFIPMLLQGIYILLIPYFLLNH